MSTVPLYLYDDPADLPSFLPFTASRPIGELRHGAWLLRERWVALGWGCVGHVTSPHLRSFVDVEAPRAHAAVPEEGARLLMRSTFVPHDASGLGDGDRPIHYSDADGTTVGGYLPRGTASESWATPQSWRTVVVPGRRLRGVWELIADLVPTLQADLERIVAERGPGRVPAGCTVIGDPSVIVSEGAVVEPQVVFDVRGGPIVLERGVEVRAFTRLHGPLHVGPGTRVVGGQVRESAIGPRCVVHGEISNSLFLGFANKSHDGFLGHSVIGRWVNLGAGTVTSNLKNTYGPVRLDLGAARIETGMTFLGALVGDHAKTAIGTMLPTGCVIGVGANVFGTRRPEAHVPAFAWGTEEPGRTLACRMFLQTAERVLPRRDVPFDDAVRNYLTAVWEAATGQSCG